MIVPDIGLPNIGIANARNAPMPPPPVSVAYFSDMVMDESMHSGPRQFTAGNPLVDSPTILPCTLTRAVDVLLIPANPFAAVMLPVTVIAPVEVDVMPHAVDVAVTLPVTVQVPVDVMLTPSPVDDPAATLLLMVSAPVPAFLIPWEVV